MASFRDFVLHRRELVQSAADVVQRQIRLKPRLVEEGDDDEADPETAISVRWCRTRVPVIHRGKQKHGTSKNRCRGLGLKCSVLLMHFSTNYFEMGAGITTSRLLSEVSITATTRGLTSGIGTSPGRTHTLWPAEPGRSGCGRLTFLGRDKRFLLDIETGAGHAAEAPRHTRLSRLTSTTH